MNGAEAAMMRPDGGRGWWLAPTTFAAAMALHALHIALAGWGEALRSAYPNSDAFFYVQTAWHKAFVDPAGGYLGSFTPDSPYVWVLTAAYRWFGPHSAVPFWTNAVLMSLAVVFTALTTRRLFGAAAAWATALLGVLCGPLVFFAGITVKVNIELPLIAAGFYCALRHLQGGGVGWLLLALLLPGLAAIDRNTVAFLPLLILAVALWQGHSLRQTTRTQLLRLMAFVVSVGAVLTLSNWQFGAVEQTFFSPVGINFYAGNAPGSRGGYTPIAGLRDNMRGHLVDGPKLVERRLGRPVNRSEASAYWFRLSYDHFSRHPEEYLLLQSRKLAMMLAAEAYGLPEQFGVWRWQRPALMIALVDFAVILALAVPGLLLLRRGGGSRLGWLLLVSALLYGGSQWLFFIGERYRLPLYVMLLPFAGYGLVMLLRQRPPGLALLAIGVLALSWLLTAVPDYGPGWAKDKARVRVMEAQRLVGLTPIYELQEELPRRPFADGWLALARYAQQRRFDGDDAVYIERALALEPARVDAYELLAAGLLRSSDEAALRELLERLDGLTPSDPQDEARLQQLKDSVAARLRNLQRSPVGGARAGG